MGFYNGSDVILLSIVDVISSDENMISLQKNLYNSVEFMNIRNDNLYIILSINISSLKNKSNS